MLCFYVFINIVCLSDYYRRFSRPFCRSLAILQLALFWLFFIFQSSRHYKSKSVCKFHPIILIFQEECTFQRAWIIKMCWREPKPACFKIPRTLYDTECTYVLLIFLRMFYVLTLFNIFQIITKKLISWLNPVHGNSAIYCVHTWCNIFSLDCQMNNLHCILNMWFRVSEENEELVARDPEVS